MIGSSIRWVNAVLISFLFLAPLASLAQSEKTMVNLDQLLEEALQNNPEILAARQKWEVFKEKVPQASAPRSCWVKSSASNQFQFS
jgi:hypothetical protein